MFVYLRTQREKVMKQVKTHEQRIAQMEKAERARRILRELKWRREMLFCLDVGWFVPNEVRRVILKEMPEIARRNDLLCKRIFRIERFIWENA